jgi:copper chaperone
MNILVFKTNIRYKKQLRQVQPVLNNIEGLYKWNVDFQDNDKVLRLETTNVSPTKIQSLLNQLGYYCEELV